MPELIAQEKAKPGTYLIGSSTPTTQVSIEFLNTLAGTKFTVVPYKGGSTQVTGLLGGEIPVSLESANVALPLYRAGRLKILALTTAARMSRAPELPLVVEAYPQFNLGIWQSIVAPAGTPRAVIENSAWRSRRRWPIAQLQEKILNADIEPAVSNRRRNSPTFLRAQAALRARMIRSIGLKLD